MSVMRKLLLAGSTSPWLRRQATRRAFVRRSVSKFMPGETVDEALRAAATLKPEGINTILTRLGENLTGLDEAEQVTQHYLDVLDKAKAAGLDAEISVKPTQLGLDLDPAVCQRNLDRIVAHAEQTGNFVWIDMESSPYVDPTLKLFRASRERSRRIGLAMQAYLYRTAKDVEDLLPLGPAVRIVKGAYLEPPDIAFPKKSDVDENFYTLCCRLMSADAQRTGSLLHVATHDVALADRLSQFITANDVPTSAYEFAMLYGIQRTQQQRLARDGRRLRVLISYGEYWFPWYMRRLAERPANVMFVLRNLVGG
ncbi:MAG TPA: proline dehydrogenase family protein [Vicinamibacterales bacterium]|nr:proline dehydrogenase family protein [Vicinamibacterales bacterium]